MYEFVPWLGNTWQQLIVYKKNNFVPSSLLISGPSGIGKTGLVKAYAQTILCSSQGEACGVCRSCTLFQVGNHPDFFLVETEEKSSVIKIEQIRELIDSLNQTAVLEGFQVAVISLAEEMNKSSANALLKTLEEPRGKVLILLISNQPNAIVATVRSRCQHIKIPVPSKQNASVWLQQKINDVALATLSLSIADNLPLKALEYASEEQQSLRNTMLNYFYQVQKGTLDPIVAAADCLTDSLAKLHYLMTFTVDVIRIKFCAEKFASHQDKISLLTEVSKHLSIRQLYLFLETLFDAIKQLKSRNNINLQLLMEKVFINWRYNNEIS